MDLPEQFGIELVGKLLDRFADKRFRVGRDHQRVLVVGMEIGNLISGDQTHVVAQPRSDPAQMAALRVQCLGELFKQPSSLAGAPPIRCLSRAIVVASRAGENGFIT